VRTAMVLMAPAASLLAVALAGLVSGSVVTAWKPASAVSASRPRARCVRQRSCAALVIEAIE